MLRGDQPGTPNASALGQSYESSYEPPTASTAKGEGAEQGQGRGRDGQAGGRGFATAAHLLRSCRQEGTCAGHGERVHSAVLPRHCPGCPRGLGHASWPSVTRQTSLPSLQRGRPAQSAGGSLTVAESGDIGPGPSQGRGSLLNAPGRPGPAAGLPSWRPPQPWVCHPGKITLPTMTVKPAGLRTGLCSPPPNLSSPLPPRPRLPVLLWETFVKSLQRSCHFRPGDSASSRLFQKIKRPTSGTSLLGEERVLVYVCDVCAFACVRACTRLCSECVFVGGACTFVCLGLHMQMCFHVHVVWGCICTLVHMCTHACVPEQGCIPSSEGAVKFLSHHRCLVLELGRPGLVLPSPNCPALLTQGGRQMLPVSCYLTLLKWP